MLSMGLQLTLGLKLNPRKNLLSFVSGPNHAAIDKLKLELASPLPFFLLLQATSGSGKTHLLQAACQDLVYRGSQAAYIDLAEVHDFALMGGLDRLSMVCIDHLESLAENPDSYQSLVQFLKDSVRRERKILLASSTSLPQLESDFPGLHLVTLGELESEQLSEILKMKSRERGLSLPDDVSDLVLRKSRSCPGTLVKILDHIETRLSEHKRRPTLKFVKDVIRETAALE